MRSAVGAVALVLLLLPLSIDTAEGSHSTPPTPGSAEWWGPTDPDAGFHIRIPVTVRNPLDHPVETLGVKAQIDVAKALSDAGWVHTSAGGRNLLKGFELDPDSIRVVRVSGLDDSGQVLVHDRSRGGTDANVVPSTVVEGFVEGTTHAADPVTSPLLTVSWWTSAPLGGAGSSADTQYYHVYLDSRTNRDHPPADLEGADVGAVEAMHWAGPSTTYYGAMPPLRDGQDRPSVTLLGLHDGTKVDVDLLQGTNYVDHDLRPVVDLDEGDATVVGLGNGADGAQFRLRSVGPDGGPGSPFLAFGELQGFVPALTGGHAGRSFLVQAPEQDLPLSVTYIAPHSRPVTVTATPLTEDASGHSFQLNGGNLPYNEGAWADPGGSCTPAQDAPALDPASVYRITATDDILVALGGQMRMQQVPSLDGGPVGDRFAFSMEEHWRQPLRGGGCQWMEDERSWWAMDGTSAYATSPESTPNQFDPSPTTTNPNPRHAIPDPPGFAGAFRQNGGHADRPIYVHGDDMTVLAGSLRTGQTAAGGTYGGAGGGLRFHGVGAFTVVGLYQDTSVEVTVDHRLSGVSKQQRFLSDGQALTISDNANGDAVDGFVVEADKPVAVYGQAERASFLAGRPAFAEAEVGVADYRGHLLDLSSASGVDPVTASTIPGEPVTFTFFVSNLGRNADGSPLEDQASLRVGPLPDGWTAELDRSLVALGSGPETVHLTVTPPEDAQPREQGVVAVIAQSQGNPSLSVSAGTVTFIKSSFDVGAWFDVVGGPKFKDRTGAAGQPQAFTVVVKNEGTIADTIRLDLAGLKPGWDAQVLQDGTPVENIDLDASASAELDMVVTPPADVPEDLLAVTLTATSVSQPSTFDRITGIARVRAPADLVVDFNDTTRLVPPGEDVAFPIHVRNAGEGSVELDLDASFDLPEGWSEPAFQHVNPITGERTPIPRLSVGPGEEVQFVINTTLAADALAGDLGTVRALARALDGESSFEAAFTAVAAPRHDLDVGAEEVLAGRSDGSATPFDLEVTNRGNLDERLRLQVVSLPAAWRLEDVGETIEVPQGQTATLTGRLVGPVGAPPGTFNLTVALVAEDGNATPVTMVVEVPDASALLLDRGAVEEAQPGRAVLLDLNVTNGGNRPATVEVRGSDEAWEVVGPASVPLRPGERAKLRVGWQVPASAPDGTTDHGLDIALVPDDGSAAVVKRVSASIDVGRPQVRITEAEPTDAPGGRLVRATVENAGDRGAHDVRVRLTASDEVVDEVVVEFLAAGDKAVLSLLDPDGSGRLQLVLDPDDAIVESDEGDNVLEVDVSARGASAVHGLAVLAILVALARVRGRSRW